MKKICVITAARSEYGHLKWLMMDIEDDSNLELQTIVTGGHLSHDQGHTIDIIKEDGIPITEIVDACVDNSSEISVCETMTRYSDGFTKAFSKLNPDCIVVLGDRYELLPICSVAFMMQIPIVHISGGDVTEGALDDGIRNAITMLATYHFPGTQASADNIIRMRGTDKNVYTVGEPSLDLFTRTKLLSREELADNLCLDVNKRWVLCTLHSETANTFNYNVTMAENLKKVLQNLGEDYQIIITKANADFGGREINQILGTAAEKKPASIKQISSLGQLRYLSFMKQVDFVIGNSSSGIVETPFMEIPTINIGDRQKGRYLCSNIVQSDINYESINTAVANIDKKKAVPDRMYWGDGHTSEKIISTLKRVI